MSSQGYSRGFRGGRGGGRGRDGGAGQKRSAPGSFGGYDEGGKKKRTALENCHRFLVPADLVKVIIGKGGSNIKEVIEKTREIDGEAKISIYAQCANGNPLMEGAADRVMGIQANTEGLKVALENIIPFLQYESRPDRKKKLEVRFLAPAHSCSAVIGKGGSIIKGIKADTKSFIQVYTVPLPCSDETVIRMQNFESDDLVSTVLRVAEAVAPNKTEKTIVFYDPIWFEQGEYGDTGSYVDTFYFQNAISNGEAQLTPYTGGRNSGYGQRNAQDQYNERGSSYDNYREDPYAQSTYSKPAYDGGYDQGQDYGQAYGEDYGNYDHVYNEVPTGRSPRGGSRGGRATRRPMRARGGY